MSMPSIRFSHGQESGPWGTKIRIMADAARDIGCNVDSIDYQGISDPSDRTDKLVAHCADLSGPVILVGSSMGGHVATAAATLVDAIGLFVLAPAYYMEGFEELTPLPPSIPIEIVHGWHDDIVPVQNSIRFARESGATLHLVDGDHRLTANIDEITAWFLRFVQNQVSD